MANSKTCDKCGAHGVCEHEPKAVTARLTRPARECSNPSGSIPWRCGVYVWT
jgi:hypothetical protein